MGEKYFRQPSTTNTQQHFSAIPKADIERSTFDRSHGIKTTIDQSRLYPIFIDEVLPGDTFKCKATIFARMATPLHPVMDNIYLDTHFFFVPNRLVWTNWVNFMGERLNPTDNPEAYSIPQTTINLAREGTNDVASYMGIPFNQGDPAGNVPVSALPFRMYKLIWNEWYRDQNLSNSVTVQTGNGPDNYDTMHATLLPRYKRHDYFTSALPWPQKGSPVSIDLGSTAELGYRPIVEGVNGIRVAQGDLSDNRNMIMNAANNNLAYASPPVANAALNVGFAASNMYVDLTTATAVTINDLRTAFQIQRLLERDARGGTRYNEVVLSHFGVSMPYSNWRTEYIGGGHTMVNITPIATTFANSEIATGDLGAVATGLGTAGFEKSFTEHGFVIGLISIRGDLNYQNGIERFWSRKTRYDYYWPVLAHLSEQAILNKEVFVSGTDATDDSIWGYQERYAEYRYKPGRITGALASNYATSLDSWHVAQDFETLPPLNEIFMIDAPSMSRVLAVANTTAKFIVDGWFDLKCQRPMPTYSVPGLVDHF